MDGEKKKRIVAMAAMIFGVAVIVASAVAFSYTSTSSSASNYGNDAASPTSHETSDTKNVNSQDQFSAENATSPSNSDISTEEKTNAENHGSHKFSETTENSFSSDSSSETQANSSSDSEAGTTNDLLTVNITVDASGQGNVHYSGNVELDEGASVYDALKATGLSINARDTQYGVYVVAIGGVAEKSAGGESGWKYSVNGSEPGTSCSNYILKRGDVVKWKFVTKASEAVG